MNFESKTLVLDLLEWVDCRPRSYAEVMDSWRTSCPRLPVWEDAVDHGFVALEHTKGSGTVVVLTSHGRTFLSSERPPPARPQAPAAATSPSTHRA